MSRIEGVFLTLALEIGLAEAIAETLKDIDRAIAELPATGAGRLYRHRLAEQRAALRNPTLRISAALVASMCAKNPALTTHIRRAFADLAERHPALARFYVQLPQGLDPAAAKDDSDPGHAIERRWA